MGQTLSEPITEKETEYGENDFLFFGVSAMQGWRITMEDAHAAELSFSGDDKAAFFAVYDGHGGNYTPCLVAILAYLAWLIVPCLLRREFDHMF